MSRDPEVLILGSRYDLTCDFVVAALLRKGVPYLRLNSEDLPTADFELDPSAATLTVDLAGHRFQVSDRNLRSVLYRRPTFLRLNENKTSDARSELLRVHWATFMRSLVLFEGAGWVNHPSQTYLAEHKAVQIRRASALGFSVPRTRIANTTAPIPAVATTDAQIVVKGLDTVLFRELEREVFGFTQFVDVAALSDDELQAAPVIMQQALQDKTDLRITVVGETVFAVEITRGGQPIRGDWRCASRDAEYAPTRLPREVENRCLALTKSLGLRFGAIDLALQDGRYYFLEINPTGEWAWLVDAAGLAIDQAVADLLIAGR